MAIQRDPQRPGETVAAGRIGGVAQHLPPVQQPQQPGLGRPGSRPVEHPAQLLQLADQDHPVTVAANQLLELPQHVIARLGDIDQRHRGGVRECQHGLPPDRRVDPDHEQPRTEQLGALPADPVARRADGGPVPDGEHLVRLGGGDGLPDGFEDAEGGGRQDGQHHDGPAEEPGACGHGTHPEGEDPGRVDRPGPVQDGGQHGRIGAEQGGQQIVVAGLADQRDHGTQHQQGTDGSGDGGGVADPAGPARQCVRPVERGGETGRGAAEAVGPHLPVVQGHQSPHQAELTGGPGDDVGGVGPAEPAQEQRQPALSAHQPRARGGGGDADGHAGPQRGPPPADDLGRQLRPLTGQQAGHRQQAQRTHQECGHGRHPPQGPERHAEGHPDAPDEASGAAARGVQDHREGHGRTVPASGAARTVGEVPRINRVAGSSMPVRRRARPAGAGRAPPADR